MPPQNDNDLSALGHARERLYTPAGAPVQASSSFREARESTLSHAWENPPLLSKLGGKHHVRLATRFFIAALIFFVIAGIAAGALFFFGGNTVSVDNVALDISGPTTIASGDATPLSVTITNKNPVAISNATLEVDFPDGTRSSADVTQAYPRYVEDLGTLSSGETIERSVKAVFFGSEGQSLTIPVSVSYGSQGSNAVFVKRMTYPLTLTTAPLSVSLDTVSQTVSGKSFSIVATVRSNASVPISGVVLAAQYPTGYSVTSSTIAPVGTNFPIGTLKPGASKTVTIVGTLSGQNADQRFFHFTVGTGTSANDLTLAVPYMTQDASVSITAPFLATSITVNGSSADTPVVAPGTPISVTVSWVNTLSTAVANADIEIALAGSALDTNSIKTQNGFYRSNDRTIIFSRDTDPSLASISPGSTGIGTFSFSTLSGGARGSSVTLTLSIAGQRTDGNTGQVSASSVKTIKIASAVSLTTTTVHNSGTFANTGPIPPVADQATSYGVVWNLTNAGNDIADASVSAALPSYVTFTSMTSPPDGTITYNSSSHMVTWKAGDLPAGTSRQGAFQVILTPSTSQKGSTPALTTAPTFSGYDRFAQAQVTITGTAATTATPGDPGYSPASAIVQ